MIMKKFSAKAISLFVLAALGLLCLYAVHDVQTAGGLSLLLNERIHGPIVLSYVIVDFLLMVLLIASLILPLMVAKELTSEKLAQFFILFVAFVPSINPAILYDDIINFKSLAFYSELYKYKLLVISYFRFLIPLIIILWGILVVIKSIKPKKANTVLIIISAVLMLSVLPFSGLYDYVTYIVSYLLVIVLYNLLSKLSDKLWPVYVLFLLTAFYRIISFCMSV